MSPMEFHARRGPLVVHGGGRTKADLYRDALNLAGGPSARVLIVPQASSTPAENGVLLTERFREVGAETVDVLDLASPPHAVAQVQVADLVWMSSGDQVRLMNRLKDTGVAEALLLRHHQGATLCGISAGAAAMSRVMITGEDDDPITGATDVIRGLALWPEVIVDQHFLARNRMNRLRRAVLEHPELVGVGVDEDTYVIVLHGRWIRVVGLSNAVIVDARRGEPALATLGPGAIYDLDPGPFGADATP